MRTTDARPTFSWQTLLPRLARSILPATLHAPARLAWRAARRGRDEVTQTLWLGLPWLEPGQRPRILLHFGATPGDDLLCTAVVRELRRRGKNPIWMVSNHPDLFGGSADVARVVPVSRHQPDTARQWPIAFRPLEYARFDGDDRSEPPNRHIIAELCARAGITGTVALRPYLALRQDEIEGAAWAAGHIAIQSSGMAGRSPMANKQWLPERFQSVVDALAPEHKFVQLGSAGDPPLQNVRDWRDRTTIREAAAILHHARLYIGTVGFLMHVARAVECPSVIVYGGREAPWQSGYPCNVNLYTSLECAPCWRWNRCEFERSCMSAITADEVVQGARKLLGGSRGPLATEAAEL